MSLTSFVSYLGLEKNYSPHTIRSYEKDISDFSGFCVQEFDLDDIESVDYSLIRSWIVRLANDKIANRSINRKISSLKAYYKFLQQIGSISKNPLAGHKALKTPKKVEIPFSEKEMEEVLRQIPFDEGFEGCRDKLIIELLYATGMRRAELIQLQMVDIDLPARRIRVLGKRNKERIIPLLDSLIGLFEAYLEERKGLDFIADPGRVFLTKSGHKIYETLVYRIINGYFSKVSSKVKKSPHILRHTFATHLLNQGADLNAVKELLGHSSLASTQVYTHNSIAELKKIHSASHPRSKE
ncbi:tyrosine-type recombinase/integrase [Poritiphilus flavus]|uniref:Tyrosine recombinase XerC n=1 Tax=Poritiphilus flavus TaxID=2697053 RepID=A0A6L9EAN9_9FLAO|nr:tyrosine-type recombinase/integrase [Poritiphilus flavus]NAS11806.1 tyrosine-type recombinase/integrase [Poritiphilus flavus]